MHQLALEDTSAVILFPCRLQLGSILYSLISPHPTSSSTRTRMRTPPTTITLVIRSYALCACALSQSSYNPFFFSPSVFLLGRIVFHVSSSAQRRGGLQKVTRRKRICEWTPWCVPAHRSEGGGDLCRCTPAPERPLLRLTPHIPAPPLPPPVTMPLPPDEWGSRDISSVTMQGSHQILQLPVPFTTWKHVSPIWWSCMIFLCARFVGLEARCPLFFSPGQPRAWPPN